jgi:hypothetical protein
MGRPLKGVARELWLDTGLPQHALYGRVMQPELLGNGADEPLLGVVEPENLGFRFLWDHGRPARSARRTAWQSGSAARHNAGTGAKPRPRWQARIAKRATLGGAF